ncbi:hypothetical protein R1flu_007369 [Riccia fluitans]|uniref:Zinc finger PHD-type domain-containing protein n=1 Tax=Riccia fluitans TaxID=41844 RepID=A0ABD1YZH2_9MARC
MGLYRPRKRARVEEVHCVASFGKPGCPADYEGPFRSNIRSFLHDFARGPVSNAPALSLPGVRAWTLPLQYENGAPLLLYIIDEKPAVSPALHCWAHHPVCQNRYHFIIPSINLEESSGVGKGRKLCLGCFRVIPASTKMCPGCGSDATKNKFLEARTHLLHGLVHSNGYGHLLRVNGREGGSQTLSGRELMDLWDRLCKMLRARKVSVMDVSRKYNLEFRLVHAIAYGHCWYGRWGYSFGRGSFNISSVQYANTLLTISQTSLKRFTSSKDKTFSQIVSLYRTLSKPSPVNTVGQLMRMILDLLKKIGKETSTSNTNSGNGPCSEDRDTASNHVLLRGAAACRWPPKRVEQAQKALLDILRSADKATWLSRQSLRERARSHIGDTGLLDFVLKGFVDKTVDCEVVRRRVNQTTRMLEYRLEDIDWMTEGCGLSDNRRCQQKSDYCLAAMVEHPEYDDVVQQIAYVYHAVLESMPNDAQILLDVKQLIKDYMGDIIFDVGADDPFRVLCYLVSESGYVKDSPPPELVVLPGNATVGDLKRSVEKAFRDVYMSFGKFQVVSISKLEGAKDSQRVSTFLKSTGSLYQLDVLGTGIEETSSSRHEAGLEDWIVDCPCGTRDDDGERMGECVLCQIWLHTRCAGISDCEPVPQSFVCDVCSWSTSHSDVTTDSGSS